MTQVIERGTLDFGLQTNLIVIDVNVNGHDTQFLLDTGASNTVLSQEFADRLGLEEADRAAGGGAGGTVSMSIVRVDSLSAAGITCRNLACPVAEIDELKKHIGENLNGILGFDFFGTGSLHIDYVSRRVTFERPISTEADMESIISGDRVRIDAFDVEMTLPSDAWRATTETPLPSMPVILKGPGDAEIGASIAIAHGMSVATMKSSLDASLRVQVEAFERISHGDIQRAGRPAYRVDYVGTDKGVRKKLITESLLFDSGLLILTCDAPVDAFPAVETDMEAALSSVRPIESKPE